jgi:hypothetical protein
MTPEPVREASRLDDSASLGRLYARNKALAISIGASLALGSAPEGARAEVDEHLSECERAAAAHRGPFDRHFEACRAAAADLVELVAESERDPRSLSKERLAAARGTHRELRQLVWEVFDCEDVPCAALDAAHHRASAAEGAAHEKGANHG